MRGPNRLSRRRFLLVLGAALTALALPLSLSPAAAPRPVAARRGMVVATEARAAEVGRAVLAEGGNAVDAAVAVGFALAVTWPEAGNLGGGGFMLIHRPGAEPVALDFRETAPAAATRDMFLDERGEVVPQRSSAGHLASAVPGTVAGLALAAERWGTRPLKALVRPARTLAEDGFPVDEGMAEDLGRFKGRLKGYEGTARIFYPGGEPLKEGAILKQPDLARTLGLIEKHGRDGFYRGEVARLVAAEMDRGGGILTEADLAGYHPVVRAPVRGRFRGYEILSMPPPSSGGVHLVQMLNILEPFPLEFLGYGAARTIHLMAEAMKRAYADRSAHLGDPDRVSVPVEDLTSPGYAAFLRTLVDPYRATPSSEIKPGDPRRRGAATWDYVRPAYLKEGEQTTHYSVMDGAGMAVSVTYTLNFPYGSGVVVDGAGFLLNNEMDDFSSAPGVPNAYGLLGGEANAIAPGKRPLSSMSPTIVLRDGRAVLVTGSPGGSRIITTTLQVILNVLVHRMDVSAAVAAPRFHHQWLPDELQVEEGFSPDTLERLGEMGYHITSRRQMGAAHSIAVDGDRLLGAVDPRRGGLAAGY